MKEFGSDFHYLKKGDNASGLIGHYYPDAVYYASGRQALIDLYKQMGWKRLWVPEYFCYEVLGSMERAGLNLKFYIDYPLSNDEEVLSSLHFEDGDALFRMNYFGLRSRRSNSAIQVPVVEDHTHDLIGDWASNSDADWCIASLRKSLPLAEGGILWSPKGYHLPEAPVMTTLNNRLAALRWNAMRLKTSFLDNKIFDKTEFRNIMVTTEDQFDSLELSALDPETVDYLGHFDVGLWLKGKQKNWTVLKDVKTGSFNVLLPETEDCTPFSLILLFKNEEERNRYRMALIEKNVFPAILWSIPSGKQSVVADFSRRMLSIHCDARYCSDDLFRLRSIIIGC